MYFLIKEPSKIGLFHKITNILYQFSTDISIQCLKTHMHIQGMDTCHICMYELRLDKSWFDAYELDDGKQCILNINARSFYNILNTKNIKNNSDSFRLSFTDKSDFITLDFKSNTSFDSNFKLPLIDIENEYLNVTDFNYNLNFTCESTLMNDIVEQLCLFSDKLKIQIDQKKLSFISKSENNGSNMIQLQKDKCQIFTLNTKSSFECDFNLSYIKRMVHPFTKYIEFSIDENYPLRLRYALSSEDSTQHFLQFFLAPTIQDDYDEDDDE